MKGEIESFHTKKKKEKKRKVAKRTERETLIDDVMSTDSAEETLIR